MSAVNKKNKQRMHTHDQRTRVCVRVGGVFVYVSATADAGMRVRACGFVLLPFHSFRLPVADTYTHTHTHTHTP